MAAVSTSTDRDIESVDAALRSFRRELDTDWLPDPWGWRDLTADGSDLAGVGTQDHIETMKVGLVGGRQREVPLLSTGLRLRLQLAAARLLETGQSNLSDGVRGYRLEPDGTIVHYRRELARRRDVERELAVRWPVVGVTDLRRFFRSLTLPMIERALSPYLTGGTALAVLPVLRDLEASIGYAVPEGYAAARALASLCLAELDSEVSQPFSRWIDDYRIFVSDGASAERALDEFRTAASTLGYEVASEKTRIRDSAYLRGVSTSLGDHDEDVVDPSAEARGLLAARGSIEPATFERRMRFLVRLAAERQETEIVELLAAGSASELPAAVVPRLAWLIAATADAAAARALAEKLLSVDDDLASWRALRLGAAFWYLPQEATGNHLSRIEELCAASGSVRSAWLRTIARHVPEHLDHFLSAEVPRRHRVMATAEATGARNGTSPYERVVAVGPPVETYL